MVLKHPVRAPEQYEVRTNQVRKRLRGHITEFGQMAAHHQTETRAAPRIFLVLGGEQILDLMKREVFGECARYVVSCRLTRDGSSAYFDTIDLNRVVI